MSTPPVNINNSLLQESSLSKMRRNHSGHYSNGAVGAKSFKQTETENVFQNGNFSAKYFKRDSVASSSPRGNFAAQNRLQDISSSSVIKSNNFEIDQESLDNGRVATSDVESSKPLTITGGFADLSTSTSIPVELSASSSSLGAQIGTTLANAHPNRNRRQSILSSMISSSVTGSTTTKLPGYLRSDATARSISASPIPDQTNVEVDVVNPDPHVVEIVERHLASGSESGVPSSSKHNLDPAGGDFDSLKLQGGDMTRGIYNWVNEQKDTTSSLRRVASSGSLSLASRSRRGSGASAVADIPDNDFMTAGEIQIPGGFRRSYIASKHRESKMDEFRNQLGEEVNETGQVQNHAQRLSKKKPKTRLARPNFFTNNFIEFLTIYGHFAGEDLREEHAGDDDDAASAVGEYNDDESMITSEMETSESDASENEDEPLIPDDHDIPPQLYPTISPTKQYQTGRRGRLSNLSFSSTPPAASNSSLQYQLLAGSKKMLNKRKNAFKNKSASEGKSGKKISSGKALLLLMKAFVGTGVVFLPKSFANGGLLFCNVMLVFFSVMTYYCFIVLIKSTSKGRVSGYGDIGLKTYGPVFQFLILISLALSQLGFSSTYTVFVAENLRELMKTLSSQEYGIGIFMVAQLLVFLPLSLTRNIGKLSFTALIADAFILLGLVYIFTCSSTHLVTNGVSPKISMFKEDTWTLFIGTAVFSYEGVGLLIPIQESMANPKDFNRLLLLVMGIVTLIFVTLSSISYMSYGDDVKTVILMNFPRNKLALVIQLCYAIAILLSTPLQLFPAIKIFENYLFHKNRQPWKNKIRRDSEARSIASSHEYQSSIDAGLSGGSFRDYGSIRESSPLRFGPTSSDLADTVNEEGVMSGKSDTFIKWMKNVVRVTVVLGMCFAGYLGSSDLDRFVSLIGSFTCIPLIYIYPPLLYLKSYKNEISQGTKVLNWSIFTLGVGLMSYTSFQTISTWIAE
ncbi:hypothetical protein CANARDRAFT_26163 [[Candida] arabinofermentans NRRL YB-2248]|uniref:Amino acid transporter transmembrane domain-containing protein n=1 Tax=[Candida] arabinofermentans NRRL YB-2248 TaxID=983967 RepID=A0A1E4T8C8_9ASCO|nr:hypothetical protein CANARDRAFT_26163 [[Candida] arabinofermentans NRRL YB-2248]